MLYLSYALWPYTLWQIYVAMRTIHGAYITYTFFRWFSGSMWLYATWVISFVYNPYEIKQIEDKQIEGKQIEDKKVSKLDELD
jgi:hypothetical protein